MKKNPKYSENVWLALVLIVTTLITWIIVAVTMLVGIILILLGQNIWMVAFVLLVAYQVFKVVAKQLKGFKMESVKKNDCKSV